MATRKRTKRVHRLRSKSKRRLRGGEGGFNEIKDRLIVHQLQQKEQLAAEKEKLAAEEKELGFRKESAKNELLEMYGTFQSRITDATTHAKLKEEIDNSIGSVCNSACELNEKQSVDTTKDTIITNFHKWVGSTLSNIYNATNKNALEGILNISAKAELCRLISYIGKIHVSPNTRNFEFSEKFIPPVGKSALESQKAANNSTDEVVQAAASILPPRPSLVINAPNKKRVQRDIRYVPTLRLGGKHNKQTKRFRRRS